MKKLLSILLCAAILASLTPSVFASTQTYANTFSDYTWTFSEETDITTYGSLGNAELGSTATIVTDSSLAGAQENNNVIKLDRPSTSTKNVNISFLDHTKKITASEIKVAFDFKTTTAATKFKFVLRNTGDLNAVEWQNGKIKFLNQADVGTYSADVWYNVELLFNIPKGYGQLKMKEAGTNVWTTYNVLAGNGALSGWDTTCRLAVGLESVGTAYVDNYYQNTVSVPAAFLGSDDFTSGIDGWTTKGGNMIDTIYAQQVDVDGNKMLEIKADNAAEKKNTSARIDFPAYTLASLDTYLMDSEVYSTRSGREDDDIWAAVHFGDNFADHGQYDMGTFVLDAMGRNFFLDLGSGNYNLPSRFTNSYRYRAEGHNTIVINPDHGAGQIFQSTARIDKHESKPQGAYAISDMTPAYETWATSMRRGLKLDNYRRTVTLQDEVRLKEVSDFWWFAHTEGQIEVSEDGKSAYITLDDKTLLAEIINGENAVFSVTKAVPLPTSPQQPGQEDDSRVNKLTIHIPEC
ncbi:MAG: hypothetical protein E7395_08225, partial [Ruminococcaceae bacterium]|nr:hypothetical protein [Oscillospiraceae bacterium]